MQIHGYSVEYLCILLYFYANIDNFDATKYTLDYDKLSIMDKWLLSKLNTLVKTVDEDLNDYKIPGDCQRALQGFVDEMSNWYVGRCRERFWQKHGAG